MDAKSASEDDSSETSQSSDQKPLKPKRRSLIERELVTNMTARVTSPLSFIEPGLNTSRYGRARKIKSDKEFCDTNKSISDNLKSPESEILPKNIKSSPKPTTSARHASPKGISPMTTAKNIIEKIHNENLSLSRFGSVTKPSPVKTDKTYERKDLIQRKDNDDPSFMLKNMFSPSKSPYKPSQSSHLNIFLERASADKSALGMNESGTTDGLFDTPIVKDCKSKSDRKRARKSDSAIRETKQDSVSSSKSSSSKKYKRHTISAANAVVVKTLDFNTKKKIDPTKKQPEKEHKIKEPKSEQPKSKQPRTEQPKSKQSRTEQPKSKQLRTEQPKSKQLRTEPPKTEQPPIKQPGSSSKKKKPKIAPQTLIEMPEPQGLLIEKTSVVKTLDFDMKKKPSTLKITKAEVIKQSEPVMMKPVENPTVILENTPIQDCFATNGLFEIESLCSYSVGDLAWSRVGTYPFWPCIVTREPFTELFVKKKLFGRVERDVIHVTFFADNGRRGWIVDNMLRQYHGIEEFLTARDGFTAEDKKKDPKLYSAYFISDKKRETWNQAVSEAEQLFKEPKLIRTDILYEMLSQNKNVKILKKPKEILKTVKLVTPEKLAPDLKKPKMIKLNRTDSDVSLSESLYDSLFSDDDSKAVAPDKSRKKSFDVSDVVTACLDNMAVKTGMAKIQMQSHMDRWLQKAKSLTPEKIQKVLTPTKERKDRSSRKSKKTPAKTVTDKPYPLRKFAKESPNGILNSYQTEHDYTNYDIENENPRDNNNLNAEIGEDAADEVHYIESGTGIGTIMAVESLSDKVSEYLEALNDTEMENSTVNEDIDKDANKMHINNACDNANNEITKRNEEAMETAMENDQEPSCSITHGGSNSITNKAPELMDIEEENAKNTEHGLDKNLQNQENNTILPLEEVNKETVSEHSTDTVLSTVENNDVKYQKCLEKEQTNDTQKWTENIDENTSKITEIVENIVSKAELEIETNSKKNIKTDNIHKIYVASEDQTDFNQITTTNEQINVSNSNIIQNFKNIDTKLKNEEISSQSIVKKDLQSDFEAKETVNKTEENPLVTKRRSLRRKCEQPITAKAEHQVKDNSNDVEIMNYSEMESDIPKSTDCDQIKIVNEELTMSDSINSILNNEATVNNLQYNQLSSVTIIVNDLLNETTKTGVKPFLATKRSLRAKPELQFEKVEHQVIENSNIDTETMNSSVRIELVSPENINCNHSTIAEKKNVSNHEAVDNKLNVTTGEIVKKDLQSSFEVNKKETITKSERKTLTTRKSLRTKTGHRNIAKEEHQVNDNSDNSLNIAKCSDNVLDLPEIIDGNQVKNANEEINMSSCNINVQKHDDIVKKLKIDALSTDTVVDSNFSNNLEGEETGNESEVKLMATRSLRTMNETPISTEAELEKKENSNIDQKNIEPTNEKINVSNHIGNKIKLKNIDFSIGKVVVNEQQNNLEANIKEAVTKTEGKSRRSALRTKRTKPKAHIEKQQDQGNENSNIKMEVTKSGKIKSDFAEKTKNNHKSIELNDDIETAQIEHKVVESSNNKSENIKQSTMDMESSNNVTDDKDQSIMENEFKKKQKDISRKSEKLASLDKLNKIPQVKLLKLNFCDEEINQIDLKNRPKEVDNDIKIKNITKSCKVIIETIKENHVCDIDKTKTKMIEKTVETKQELENGFSKNYQTITNNQYAKHNGTLEATNESLSKTIPDEKVTKDLSRTEEQKARKSRRIDRKINSKKPIDWQRKIDEAKRILLEDTDLDLKDSINCNLLDKKADAAAYNITDERDIKPKQFKKEINLIISVCEPIAIAKDYDVKDVDSNVIQGNDILPKKTNVKGLSFQKVFSNLCDQRIQFATPLLNCNKIDLISTLVNDNNKQDGLDCNIFEVNSENAEAVLCNTVDVDLNSKKHIDLASLKVNELETNKIQDTNETENNIMQMTEDLDVTPEKIINADVIIENGHTDESDLDVKIDGISVISSIDTPLPRKRGRPRKSNNLVLDNVVIEEISLTEDKVSVTEDIKPRKRGRPKKYQLPEQDKYLSNGYHDYTDSLPEFAHLMDLDISIDGADFNEAVKVDNIALLTDAEVFAKVTATNLNHDAMDMDDCQVIPGSIEDNVKTDLIGIGPSVPKEIDENSSSVVQECQHIVNVNAQDVEIIESSPSVALIKEINNSNLDNDKPKNSEQEIIEKIEESKNNHQNIESISLSSVSINSEMESIPGSYTQSETDEKQTLNNEVTETIENTQTNIASKDEDNNLEVAHEEKEQETQEGTSKRKQRVKPENKLTNEVYKALDDPEFAKYLEMRQDALIDENPHVSQEDIVKYLYKTWIYEQSLKPDGVKSDDLIELNLVKGLGNNTTSLPKRIKKRVKSQVDKEEKYDLNEVIIPRDRSKRRTNALYTTADDTDIEDELEAFEILNENKPKPKKVTPTPSIVQKDSEKVIPIEIKTDSELDDVPLANLIADKDKLTNTEDLTEALEEEVIEQPFDQVEYYFSQLTEPKPNVFKGLVRERVCDICFKTTNLVKCKGPCNGMFHIDCVKEETTRVAIQNHWSRGRKKKKPRGPRPKNRSQDDSQSDDKDLNLEDILDSTLAIEIDAEAFEMQLAEKMKELLEKEKVLDLASSDEELQWDDADPGKCEIVNITLKTRRNLSNNSDIDFKCNDCLKLTIPKCYVCKSEKSPKNSVELRQRCLIAQCNKYYHLECLDLWPQTQFNQGESARKTTDLFDILCCPRHVCHSCVCDDPRGCNTRFSGEKLARCVKCPATYHSFTKCLPAGSQILSASHIICPRHTVNRPGKVPCHVNTGWCFICALGGSLICCEYCPTSFHADCLNIAPPEGNYMCEDCETGRLPLYGEMVWVKLGHYRWWPGLVLHPCEVPDNIRCMRHSPGEFVVRFFGQYDHYWVNRGRVFPFQEGDSGRISSQKSKIDEAFTLAIEHAQRAFQILKTAPPNEEEEAEIALSFLPPQYVKLRVNKPCGSVQIYRVDDEMNGLSQCDCDPRAERPCDPNSQCLNRMLLTECGPSCRAAERCQNRAFEKRLYPKMGPYRTPHRGWGLRTQEEVKAGQFVIEYVGELIDEAEFKRRMQLKHEIRDENYYFLTLDKERMIDAGPKGNLARFMNHSCEPNCETQKWTVLGDVRVGLFAIHDIPAFTELTFNYNLECAGIDKKRCMCGAARCSGYIGAKPKTLEEINPKKNIQIKKRVYKKRKKEDSPSTTNIKITKPRTTTRSKPKELTDIEKDLLIIKSATIGLPSSDSECSLKVSLDEKCNKRKRSSSFVSSEDYLHNSDVLEPSGKVLKLELVLGSQSSSSDGNL